jgi:glycosyltransferase involved in cell wall biosynthesis
MRILMLVPHRGIRGPMSRITDLLVNALRNLGNDVVTEAWGRHSDNEPRSAKIMGRLRDVVRVNRALSAAQPEVVVVHTSHEWASIVRDLALLTTLRKRASRIVLQFHGGYADRLVSPGHWFFKRVTGRLLAIADGAFVLSSLERRALESFHPGGRFHVVSNPFQQDTTADAPAKGKRTPDTQQSLLFAARLVPEKGVFEAVDALALLRERRPADLLIAGAGPAESRLVAHVRAIGLSDHVTVAGHLTSDRLWQAYRTADVFVLPTYWVEGFPTAIMEAMSVGLPIVTTKTRGIADHLRDGVHALFVPPRDAAALAGALDRLLGNDALRERMSTANREKVKDFAPDRVAADYARALREIVSS